MKKLLIPILLAFIFLSAVLGILGLARAQGITNQSGANVLRFETQGENVREISAPSNAEAEGVDPDQPQISFIDSPTAACTQPDASKDECFINWYYLSVSADPNYIITMTVKLNDLGYVARYSGFFQTSMYAPFNMNPKGYKVTCGELGVSGDPNAGNAYAYTIRARDSAGLKSANYGTLYCPAYIP